MKGGKQILDLKGKNIGFALTGSFCTFEKTIEQIKKLIDVEANIFPIMSFRSYLFDTKFGKAENFKNQIEKITGNKIIHTIQDADPIGPNNMFDLLVVAPCTRKHYSKTLKQYHRYTSNYGC